MAVPTSKDSRHAAQGPCGSQDRNLEFEAQLHRSVPLLDSERLSCLICKLRANSVHLLRAGYCGCGTRSWVTSVSVQGGRRTGNSRIRKKAAVTGHVSTGSQKVLT